MKKSGSSSCEYMDKYIETKITNGLIIPFQCDIFYFKCEKFYANGIYNFILYVGIGFIFVLNDNGILIQHVMKKLNPKISNKADF